MNDQIVLGRPFMKKYVSLFDISEKQIGLISLPDKDI